MPFKSEAQRRYLWANEPELARDWTETYGSRIHKNNGGIMHQFENYAHDDGNNVSVPRSFQARPHSDQVNLAYITPEEQGILQALKPGTPHRGPKVIPNYDSFDAAGKYTSGSAMSAAETGGKTERDRADMRQAGMSPQQAQDLRSAAINAGAGQTVNRGWFGPKHNQTVGVGDIAAAKAFRNDPNNLFAKQAYRNTRGSNFGIGNLFRGAMSMFGGWPGKIGSFAMGLGDQFSEYGKSRDYWTPEAITQRRNQKRIANMLKRRSLGKDYGEQNLYDLSEGKYDFRDDQFGDNKGITGVDAVEDFDVTDVITKKDRALADTYQGIVDPSDPEFGGGIGNNFIVDDASTWFDTHPATGESVMTPTAKKRFPYLDISDTRDWKQDQDQIHLSPPNNEETIDDVPSDTDIFKKRFVGIKDMSTAQIKDYNALDLRDKMEKSGIDIPDPLNDEEKQRLKYLRNLRNSQAINEPKSYTV